jgi:hypothetical protein
LAGDSLLNDRAEDGKGVIDAAVDGDLQRFVGLKRDAAGPTVLDRLAFSCCPLDSTYRSSIVSEIGSVRVVLKNATAAWTPATNSGGHVTAT